MLITTKNGEANDEEMSSNISNSSSNKENNNPGTGCGFADYVMYVQNIHE